MSFTFAQLKTAIQDYTDNSETTFVNHLSDFIKAAEERIFKNVKILTKKRTVKNVGCPPSLTRSRALTIAVYFANENNLKQVSKRYIT